MGIKLATMVRVFTRELQGFSRVTRKEYAVRVDTSDYSFYPLPSAHGMPEIWQSDMQRAHDLAASVAAALECDWEIM